MTHKSDIAISVRGLSKSYTIAHNQPKHTTLAEALMHTLRFPRQKVEQETFWALQDVSFDIQQGDVVGIIGRNGAGKSTLLKILSRITEPTSGQIDLYGRVGSLLEVGTGFSAELTGRENIYMNGAILGMTRREITRQFDAIVDFSGTEMFLDTPVKRYSSGMYVRLAFAVAAHLRSEILIVDEVLAVGDAEFQRKCLGKMHDVAGQEGRTVLFVSHNMAAVEYLCSHGIFLKRGHVVNYDKVNEIISQYSYDLIGETTQTALGDRTDRTGNGAVRLTSLHIEDTRGARLEAVRSGQDIVFVFGYRSANDRPVDNVDIGLSLGYGDHHLLTVLYSSYMGQTLKRLDSIGEVRCRVNSLPIAPGRYLIGARVMIGQDEADWPRDGVGEMIVEPGDFFGTGSSGYENGAPLLIRGEWQVEKFSSASALPSFDLNHSA